jgi:hypothetical protein
MVVTFDVSDLMDREHAMAKRRTAPVQPDWKAVLASDEDALRTPCRPSSRRCSRRR